MKNQILNCQYQLGQVIRHRLYGYRGVIFDVDPQCLAEEDWYAMDEMQAKQDQPWYHVLVDDGEQIAYLAQENIQEDESPDPVDHFLVDDFFVSFKDGSYERFLDS